MHLLNGLRSEAYSTLKYYSKEITNIQNKSKIKQDFNNLIVQMTPLLRLLVGNNINSGTINKLHKMHGRDDFKDLIIFV